MLLDKLCEAYLKAKEASNEKDDLSRAIKSLINRKGITTSEQYRVTITKREPKYTVDADLLKEKFPNIYKQVCTKLVPGSLILSKVERIGLDAELEGLDFECLDLEEEQTYKPRKRIRRVINID